MKLYRVDPVTGEAMDEVYYLKQRLVKEPGNKDVRDRLNALKSQRRMKLLADAGVSYRRPYKRSDISTLMLLACVQAYSWRAYEVLCETFPAKVVEAAFLRDNNRGYLNCGTSLVRCWVDPDGERLIRSERQKVIC
ncbi:DNA binding protein [Streptomyces phage KimJongPhill]|uniref:DNA binding protein n=1 Tax=Streptomyces phage KimJongPhill TaxID=2848886 RepID=A0A8F2IWA7_9CAUD|nr:DNA binding protein [Streptomyces phage KimJongPhill]QWT29837.1 DNA binding protein [Streptomyces phage KimJongPhill]